MENHQNTESSGSDKHTTIHDCAESGDIDAFQRLLEENPSLLNEKNAIMLETPLHLSAGNNKTEIVKFLLEWKGDDKVDLEAKNMYGETPLHVAAKNGSNEAAKLLLSHGALVEAKTKYGVTPLMLSVLHSIRAEDYSIVETLIEHKADCDATDDEDMNPVDYVAKIKGNGKLLDLILPHQQEERQKKLKEACSKQKERMDALEKELSNIVGMDELKTQLRKWAKGILLNDRRRAIGLKIGTTGRLPHMAFLGNPGTGKTMVARILGRLLHSVGVLETDKVKEVQRTDLIGQYIGHTGPKTRSKIKEAEGGILFVDEAYRLIPEERSGRDYGLEALEEIMSCMDDGKVLVIFAGYNEAMNRVISSNEGFSRRVTNLFNFKDLSCEELANVLHTKMKNQPKDSLLYGFKLHSDCTVDAIAELIKRETIKTQRMKMNGGLVDIMLNNAKGNLDLRLSDDCAERDELLTIKLEDFEAAMEFIPE
ncbi:ribulose bisphosphate carboxylase/oxygenase activase, chloroplastic-like [Mangifera indica]|uniref:ribulose bisphosphate carboxylase/oxygenase activase, chloroplastic-like n=1 Tax=Mangifera indica TaxID=29780 RepID=UPI001CFB1028|nr:ribulose bisphosphate carboxylase/oxygenase activase, chloroplastic-like [Mangifera indica]XP_044511199.1 ribulose bisphosphate carboxylase/oxygenase activase, chloroplastic-like [Mangifera indica]